MLERLDGVISQRYDGIFVSAGTRLPRSVLTVPINDGTIATLQQRPRRVPLLGLHLGIFHVEISQRSNGPKTQEPQR